MIRLGKYKDEYKKAKNKERFIELVLKKHPKLKHQTALRRYYDERKDSVSNKGVKVSDKKPKDVDKKSKDVDNEPKDVDNEPKGADNEPKDVDNEPKDVDNELKDAAMYHKYQKQHKKEPSLMKMMIFKDMIARNIIISREYLRRHGFDEYEMNWLEDEKRFVEPNKYAKKSKTKSDKNKNTVVISYNNTVSKDEDDDFALRIYDVPDEKAIDMVFDLFPGAEYTVRVSDDDAKTLISIIQNKLNARFE